MPAAHGGPTPALPTAAAADSGALRGQPGTPHHPCFVPTNAGTGGLCGPSALGGSARGRCPARGRWRATAAALPAKLYYFLDRKCWQVRVKRNGKLYRGGSFALGQQLAAAQRFDVLVLEVDGAGHPQLALNLSLADY